MNRQLLKMLEEKQIMWMSLSQVYSIKRTCRRRWKMSGATGSVSEGDTECPLTESFHTGMASHRHDSHRHGFTKIQPTVKVAQHTSTTLKGNTNSITIYNSLFEACSHHPFTKEKPSTVNCQIGLKMSKNTTHQKSHFIPEMIWINLMLSRQVTKAFQSSQSIPGIF